MTSKFDNGKNSISRLFRNRGKCQKSQIIKIRGDRVSARDNGRNRYKKFFFYYKTYQTIWILKLYTHTFLNKKKKLFEGKNQLNTTHLTPPQTLLGIQCLATSLKPSTESCLDLHSCLCLEYKCCQSKHNHSPNSNSILLL